MEKSGANAKKMRALFNQVVENGDDYRLIFGYTEDVSRFNYGFVHGSKTKIGNLIVGWNEESRTIVVVPTVPELSGCGDPVYYRRSEILKAYRNKYPTDAFVIYPDKKGYIGINAYDWLEDERLYVYVSPVSYTHLDVYKRQALRSRRRFCVCRMTRRCAALAPTSPTCASAWS